MAKRKRIKELTTLYKTLHIQLKIFVYLMTITFQYTYMSITFQFLEIYIILKNLIFIEYKKKGISLFIYI